MTHAEAANAAVTDPSTSTTHPGVPMTHAEAANAAVTDPSTSTANPGVPMTHAEAANAAVTDPTESERELMTDNEESMADTQRMHTPHDAALATLTDLTCELGADEVRVLARIAERLKGGQTAYGPLHLETDRREFRLKEAREEVEDALVYLACAWLKGEEVAA